MIDFISWLEDLHVWQMEKVKTTKKGRRYYGYRMATWREGGKTRNSHLGAVGRLVLRRPMQKAKKVKAEALGIRDPMSYLTTMPEQRIILTKVTQ